MPIKPTTNTKPGHSKFSYSARGNHKWESRSQGGFDAGFLAKEFPTYKAQEKNNWVRILPPTWEGAEHFGLDVYVHYSIGPDKLSLMCPRRMSNDNCPICDERVKAESDGDEELSKSLKATRRVLVWVIDRQNELAGPLLWSMPQSVDANICKLAKDPRSGEIFLLDHPEEGYNISFDRPGKAPLVKYENVRIDRSPTAVKDEWLDFITEHPLPSVLVHHAEEEITRIFEGSPRQHAQETPFPQETPSTRSAPSNSSRTPEPMDMTSYDDEEDITKDWGKSAPIIETPPAAGKTRAQALREEYAKSRGVK